jgi:hypothetical protein
MLNLDTEDWGEVGGRAGLGWAGLLVGWAGMLGWLPT